MEQTSLSLRQWGIVPTLAATGGGVFQYSLTVLEGFRDWAVDHHVGGGVIFVSGGANPLLNNLKQHQWRIASIHTSSWRAWCGRRLWQLSDGWLNYRLHRWRRQHASARSAATPEQVRLQPNVARWFRQQGVRSMLYLYPEIKAVQVGIPFVMVIHDLQHKLQPDLVEESAPGEVAWQDYVIRHAVRHALCLVVDSEVGKEDLLTHYGSYGLTPNRVKILPYVAPQYIFREVKEADRQRVRDTYRLPERYLFYPAQLWPHKNHVRLIQALALLRRQSNLSIPLVLVGSAGGDPIRLKAFRGLKSLSRHLGVEQLVYYLGYVPDEDMRLLYAEAEALVMPTLFGPTNIPIVEAWATGCPVLTSDLRGIREQVQDAGLLVDPFSSEAIADGIKRLWQDDALRQELVGRGRQRACAYTPTVFIQKLVAILQEVSSAAS